jgi:MoaA/NifB/PqqE/SkfB family radical SAM enzyme
MHIEVKRQEEYCNIHSLKNGKIIFLDKNNVPLLNYPVELKTKVCPLKSPLVVHLELTRRCGLHCKHCYISAGKPRKNELSMVEWKNILNQLKDLEVMSIYFTGGDPLLQKDCIEIVAYARNIGLCCNLLTNGLELEKNINVDNIPEDVFLMLSFDGEKGTSILRHIQGTRVLNIINNLKSKRRAFAIQGLIFRDNIDEMIQATKWCTENGIDLSLNDILPIGRTKKNSHLLLSEDQIPKLLELERSKQIQEAIRSIQLPEYPVSSPDIYQSILELVMATGRPEPGIFVAYISSDGFLYADNYYAAENWSSGYNLRHISFSDAWISAFKNERSLRIDKFSGCIKCSLLKSGGQCDLQNMAMSNNLYKNTKCCGAYPTLKKLKTQRALL